MQNLGLELRDGEPELLGVLPAREVSEVRQKRNQHLRDTPQFLRAKEPSGANRVCEK